MKAIIFDFDGVILDSEPLHYKACSYILAKLGLVLSYEEYVDKYLGLADKEMFPKLFANRGCRFSSEEIKAFMVEKTGRYQDIIKECSELPMIDCVAQYIVHASKTAKLAICSGSTRNEISAVLAKFKHGQLQAYFNTIVTSEDVQQGKPSPEGYLLTAQRLNVAPDQCMVIEDTPHGVAAAKAANMYAVALLTSYSKNHFHNADKIINNFSQLMANENKVVIEE